MYWEPIKQPSVVRHFQSRAESFRRTAEDLMVLDEGDSSAYLPAVGLLAVHSCIALADAVLVATEGERGKGQDHGEAARRLRKLCSTRKIRDAGISHFKWLLGQKNHFAYGEKPVSSHELKEAKVKMDQFMAWVFRSFPGILEEVNDA